MTCHSIIIPNYSVFTHHTQSCVNKTWFGFFAAIPPIPFLTELCCRIEFNVKLQTYESNQTKPKSTDTIKSEFKCQAITLCVCGVHKQLEIENEM